MLSWCTSMKWLLTISLLCGLAWITWSVTRGATPEAPHQLPADPTDTSPPPTEATPRVAPLPPAPPPTARDLVILPDGTRLAALNRVTGVTSIEWPADRPFSPVVGTEASPTGLQWYVHADGTRSTTQWLQMNDGTRRAVGTVAAPRPTAEPHKD